MVQRQPKIAHWRFQEWILPRRAVLLLVSLGTMLSFIGIVLLAIGSGGGRTGLQSAGGALLGVGLSFVAISFIVCMYAYFAVYQKTQFVQTTETPYADGIGREVYPSFVKQQEQPLKSFEIYRNGKAGSPKRVTLAPGVQNNERMPQSTEPYKPTYPAHYNQEPIYKPTTQPVVQSQQPTYRVIYPAGSQPAGSQPAQGSNDPLFISEPLYRPIHPQQPSTAHAQLHPQQQPSGSPHVTLQTSPKTGFVSFEDYDNPVESTPMVEHTQGRRGRSAQDDVPEPQQLVYPSARRPMTFEQISSSKVSLYDNLHMGIREEELA